MKFNMAVRNWKRFCMIGAVLALGFTMVSAEAQTLVITETNEFSDELSSPTDVNPGLQVGTNLIQGAVDANTYSTDHDYVRIALPPSSYLARLTIRITGYVGPIGSIGFFDVLPLADGNTGGAAFVGDTSTDVSFSVGNPSNIILHMEAPFAGLGEFTAYSYEIELLVRPTEPVAGTAIHKAVEITFPSESGKYYQLQYTTEFASEAWMNVGEVIQGKGGTMSAFDTTRNDTQRFYRVVKR